jgi:hypothetical protein
MKSALLHFGISGLLAVVVHAGTTIDAANASAWGANTGWINCRGDVTNGAVTGEFFCSGYLYSANCGWISLGSGAPANGYHYQNNTATDFGVNTQDYSSDGVTFQAKLRGFAYGANIGWINFEATGDPRINLVTGQLLGHVWSANTGWIALSGAGINVTTTAIFPGPDIDADGIPDPWERFYTGTLSKLNGSSDADDDGVPDAGEYAADTNPVNPSGSSAKLDITAFAGPHQVILNGPWITDLTWTSKPTRIYRIESNLDLSSPWSILLDNILPSAGATTSGRPTAPALPLPAGRRFYRVVPRLPLVP